LRERTRAEQQAAREKARTERSENLARIREIRAKQREACHALAKVRARGGGGARGRARALKFSHAPHTYSHTRSSPYTLSLVLSEASLAAPSLAAPSLVAPSLAAPSLAAPSLAAGQGAPAHLARPPARTHRAASACAGEGSWVLWCLRCTGTGARATYVVFYVVFYVVLGARAHARRSPGSAALLLLTFVFCVVLGARAHAG